MSFRFSVKSPKCPACSKRVYFREQVLASGKHWHKKCFICTTCKKGLTLGAQCDRNEKIYCQPCYQRSFGARGFRGSSFGSMAFGSFDNSSFDKEKPSSKKSRTKIRDTNMTTNTSFDLTAEDYQDMAENVEFQEKQRKQ